ncbi:hypothetical protein [Alysiella filiformis]|nr:hypothetical protein [Alysiella filiformis]
MRQHSGCLKRGFFIGKSCQKAETTSPNDEKHHLLTTQRVDFVAL